MSTSASSTSNSGIENILMEGSPIRTLVDGVLKDGSSSELTTYIELFNQFYPFLKTLTDSIDPSTGEILKHVDYSYCFYDDHKNPVLCFTADWTFIIGFHSEQFSDDDRFYNLTVTPYATMHVDFSVNTYTGPAKIAVGPSIEFVHFRAPISFELETRDKFCYSGDLNIKPISLLTTATAEFLECEITIPEETTRCQWDEGVGAKIFEVLLTEGYGSTLLDRVCFDSN
ncbi:unnamed protein product [Moneuplotes crassus]|uniref:Uncharacterized protein n=1 Tax=Euplotes crassus TaxID=5936 RepID=A0AAD1XRQ3_EUPCR|nr:unnamed protein product [Moneuplotes crassus]